MTRPSVHRHPIKGFFAGICLGVAVAILLVVYGVIALGTMTPYLVVVLGVVLGVAFAYGAPPRRRRRVAGPAPTGGTEPTGTAPPTPAVEPTPPPAVIAASEPNVAVEPTDAPEPNAAPEPSAAPEPGATTAEWLPTHTVPPDGLTTYAGVEAGGAVNGQLDPDLPVQVIRREGDWANVVCSNGWTVWVDARQLIERAP